MYALCHAGRSEPELRAHSPSPPAAQPHPQPYCSVQVMNQHTAINQSSCDQISLVLSYFLFLLRDCIMAPTQLLVILFFQAIGPPTGFDPMQYLASKDPSQNLFSRGRYGGVCLVSQHLRGQGKKTRCSGSLSSAQKVKTQPELHKTLCLVFFI